jgi:hypothetical protein
MSARKNHIQKFFNSLSFSNLSLVDEFYAPDAEFSDPIVRIKGRAKITEYYQGLYQNVESIRFEFSSLIEEGDTCAAVWTMYLKARKLKGGDEIALAGVSHFLFSPGSLLVDYHRDYFDMGAFVYEHIPLLGSAIRAIKRRLHS